MFNHFEAKFPIVIDRACPADFQVDLENHGSFRNSFKFDRKEETFSVRNKECDIKKALILIWRSILLKLQWLERKLRFALLSWIWSIIFSEN